jgi:hypothetical protein
MTILGVKNQLVSHFLSHDTYDPNKHAFDVVYDKETADFREQLTCAALEQLELSGFVKKLVNSDRAIWVLVQPISSYAQNVVISPIMADMIANVVNFHNEIDELDYIVDKTKIDEGAIARLLNVISEYDDAMMEGEEEAQKQGGE